MTVKRWYGQGERNLDITSATAVWYHTGLPAVPVRWVLVRDPLGKLAPQAFLCTQTEADPAQIADHRMVRDALASRSDV